MKTTISLSTPAELETESLVAVVLDHAEAEPNVKEKDKKPQLKVATSDAAVQSVAADLLASGEVAGKPFETNLLHKPASLKAKRLLLISGGSVKKFSSYDLRRLAGVAVRALKSRGFRSFAFVAPTGIPAEEAVRAAAAAEQKVLPMVSWNPAASNIRRTSDSFSAQGSARTPSPNAGSVLAKPL